MKSYKINYQNLSKKHGFNLSAKYDQSWMFDNSMGPNPMWLTEWVSRDLEIKKDMLVLDMGSGKAMSSIFLAKEFGCTVFSNDLWIAPDDNLKRIEQYSCSKKVYPIKSEAHALPYAPGFFDLMICIDAYIYFGTDDLYLRYYSQFVKPEGRIAIVVPGWKDENNIEIKNKEAFPEGEFTSFHSNAWWETHFKKTGLVEIEHCDSLHNGHEIWLESAEAMVAVKADKMQNDGSSKKQIKETLEFWKADVQFLKSDFGEQVAIHRLISRRTK